MSKLEGLGRCYKKELLELLLDNINFGYDFCGVGGDV